MPRISGRATIAYFKFNEFRMIDRHLDRAVRKSCFEVPKTVKPRYFKGSGMMVEIVVTFEVVEYHVTVLFQLRRSLGELTLFRPSATGSSILPANPNQ